MKFVENAKQAWKWFSVQALVLIGLIQSSWEMYPELKTMLPPTHVYYITIGLVVLGILGRIIKQASADESK